MQGNRATPPGLLLAQRRKPQDAKFGCRVGSQIWLGVHFRNSSGSLAMLAAARSDPLRRRRLSVCIRCSHDTSFRIIWNPLSLSRDIGSQVGTWRATDVYQALNLFGKFG